VLTPAEWKVAEWVRHGLTNRRIAERSGVSPDAVKFHVGNVLGKLGMSSRAELRLWDGVAQGTALATRRTAMGDEHADDGYVMLGQVARTTGNAAAAREWYRDVLGLPELYSFGNLSFFDLGGVRLMLTEHEGGSAPESLLYLRVARHPRQQEGAGSARGQVHPRAAPDPPPRGRHRGVDGVLRGQRRPPAGADDASAQRGGPA
jgi:DNA-binding CsgD family transcriptional regulator/catechol 2,3-dioxygenase-like lactoylglutathione lyase family enzyme